MKNLYKILGGSSLFLPILVLAQGPSIGGTLSNITAIINTAIIPFLLVIAGLVFIWGVFQYLIAGGADEEKRKSGRDFIVYGLIGFVVIFGFWGLVNIAISFFGLGTGGVSPTPPTL